MKLSVVIPAHNEEGCIEQTVRELIRTLVSEAIPHEVLVINDHSSDATEATLKKLITELPTLRYLNNSPPNGYGFAVKKGLNHFEGDAVAVCMADASDPPKDLVKFYRAMLDQNVDCVFGTRFHRDSRVIDYPQAKLILNRIVNFSIRILFCFSYNDVTNGFKLFKKNVIVGTQPFWSDHFSLALEIPLKAIVRGYTYAVVPNDWINRKAGESKLNLFKMGPQYFSVIWRCFLEKYFKG